MPKIRFLNKIIISSYFLTLENLQKQCLEILAVFFYLKHFINIKGLKTPIKVLHFL